MALNTNPSNNPTIKWGALFIIGLMLLSGVAVFFGSQSSSQNNSTNTNNTNQSVEQYFSEDVPGTVVQLFNTAIVGGQTKDGDKTSLDEKLNSLSGVESITSQFSPLNEDGIITYIANLNLSAETDHAAFAQSVIDLGLFDSPEVYFQASAQVEQEQEVYNSKQQLTRINLPNAQIQAIVSPNTLVGDSITGSLAAAFQGTQLVTAYMLESQNITASPTPISLTTRFPIQSLQPSLSIVGMVDYFPGLSKEFISADVDELPSVTSVSVPFFPSVNNQLQARFADANTLSMDVNAFVSSKPESFNAFLATPDGFVVGLNQINVSEAKIVLTDYINTLRASNTAIDFTPPRTQFLMDVNTLNASNSSIATAIEEYFASLDANASVDVYQNGFVSADSLSTTDGSQTYPLDNNSFSVAVWPGHQVRDGVSIVVNAIALRGKIVYVNGVEDRVEE
ncbi:MAG: hypothetical protein FJY86_02605 [Candidatus Diapherotrites archaeon]|uniref:Uncharacterized protein n=1 Tax=Candidatus Iainarchaeum sp. TaxID=3101447 RepID=A0A8T4C7D3_9ARCH|nr:hypothetical protein [Candidatus Diapherotrites archaeon]